MRWLLLPLLLGACVAMPGTGPRTGFDAATEAAAFQRMRFVAEAVCLNETTRAGQDRAARRLGFPVRERDGGQTLYVNPGTLTFLRLGPAPVQVVQDAGGADRRYGGGHGCSVGSPAVGLAAANKVAGDLLAPRLVEGDRLVSAPVGAGSNDARGVGLFFERLSVTVPVAQSTIADAETGEGAAFVHPVVLIIHGPPR